VIHHTFSIHAWILKKADAAMSILSKDRNVFTTPGDENHFDFRINADNTVTVEFTKDIDTATQFPLPSTATVGTDWVYLVLSVAMTNGYQTDVTFYFDDVPDALATTDNIYMKDLLAYKAYIAAKRSAADTFGAYFNGFIYLLAVW
jgi:hypothetical protein